MPSDIDQNESVHHLPRQLTPFVGRQDELGNIARRLADPSCRLLTLVGPGGIGKTRLAIESSSGHADQFPDGVYFVDLQTASSFTILCSSVADALDVHLSSQEEPTIQICSDIGDQEMLLILDNFEQLLDYSEVLTQALLLTPNLKFLITSREALNLQEEWLYPVSGMPVPEASVHDDTMAYGSIELFVESARRARPDFSLEAELDSVTRVCQLVDGTPLAIELAASWCRTLGVSEIADEIQRGIDFLTTNMRNVPERHRSMQAVFDQSWQLLTEEERDVFKRLAVNRGGFTREAARAIAGASLPILSSLVDKSLLRRDADGRYHVHELLRQFATDQLATSADDVVQAQEAHSAFYVDFLAEQFEGLFGGGQMAAVAEIETELDNVRTAWAWVVDHMMLDQVRRAERSLMYFYEFSTRYVEGANEFGPIVQTLLRSERTEEVDRTLGTILVSHAWNLIRLGRLDEAEAILVESQNSYRRIEEPPPLGLATDPAAPLAVIATVRGDYALAERLGEQVLQAGETHGNLGNREIAYYLLTRAALLQGRNEEAQQFAEKAYAVTEELQDRWFMALVRNEMGNAASALGDFDAAKTHYEAGYALGQEFDDPENMADSLVNLGHITLHQQEFQDAQRMYEESLGTYQKTGDKGGIATALAGLGNATIALGDLSSAQQQFRDGLEIAQELQFVPLMLKHLIGLGEILISGGDAGGGIELLALAQHHPGSDHEAQQRAADTLQRFESRLSSEGRDAAVERGQSRDLDDVAKALLAAPAIRMAAQEISVPATGDGQQITPTESDELVEQLTQRESEVLERMSAGLTNQQIAEELFMSIGTVKWYSSQIYGKLDVRSRTQAIARARELALLP